MASFPISKVCAPPMFMCWIIFAGKCLLPPSYVLPHSASEAEILASAAKLRQSLFRHFRTSFCVSKYHKAFCLKKKS